MGQKSVKLNKISSILTQLVKNLSASNDFDYHYDPIDMHTNWDYITPDSVRVAYDVNGSNAPEIDTHHYYDRRGLVITFDTEIGGNAQIFFNNHLLALRQIGNPSGWSYLGLDGNEKLYISEDTAHVLNDVVRHMNNRGHDYMNDKKNMDSLHSDVAYLSNHVSTIMTDIHNNITPQLDSLSANNAVNGGQQISSLKSTMSSASDSIAANSNSIESLSMSVKNVPTSSPTTNDNESNSVSSLSANANSLNSDVTSLSNKGVDLSNAAKTYFNQVEADIGSNTNDINSLSDAVKSIPKNQQPASQNTNADSSASSYFNQAESDIAEYKNSMNNKFTSLSNKVNSVVSALGGHNN